MSDNLKDQKNPFEDFDPEDHIILREEASGPWEPIGILLAGIIVGALLLFLSSGIISSCFGSVSITIP